MTLPFKIHETAKGDHTALKLAAESFWWCLCSISHRLTLSPQLPPPRVSVSASTVPAQGQHSVEQAQRVCQRSVRYLLALFLPNFFILVPASFSPEKAWRLRCHATPKCSSCSPERSFVKSSRQLAPRSGELRMQKFKSHLMRTQSLKVLSLKPGVGQYIAMHATLTAWDFFLANFYSFPVHSTAFFQNLSRVFPTLAAANRGSLCRPRNTIGHPAGCRFPC